MSRCRLGDATSLPSTSSKKPDRGSPSAAYPAIVSSRGGPEGCGSGSAVTGLLVEAVPSVARRPGAGGPPRGAQARRARTNCWVSTPRSLGTPTSSDEVTSKPAPLTTSASSAAVG